MPVNEKQGDPDERSFLIEAGWVVTANEQGDVHCQPQQVVACRGQNIVYVGPRAGLPADFQPEQTIDARWGAVTPGLVNTHNHAAMTLLRGYADDLPLMPWLQEKVWPAEARLTGDDIYWGTLLAIAEQFRAGITTFADMYFHMDRVAQAVVESGARAYLSRGLIGINPDADAALAQGVDLVTNWHGAARGRLTAALAPHAPYTCPDSFVQEVLAEARRLQVGLQIHLAETEDEVKRLQEEKGLTPIAWAEEQNLLDLPVLAAHCVHLTEEDIDTLARHQVAVSHNPTSNLKLASGVAPVTDLLAAGVTVGVGTDGACSTNHLNLFEEIRLAAGLQKVRTMDATALDAATSFRMATLDGARACGLQQVGRIAPGWRADLVIFDLDSPHLTPHHDILSLLIYSAQTVDVRTVFVDGQPVMVDGHLVTINEPLIIAQCQKRAARLVN